MTAGDRDSAPRIVAHAARLGPALRIALLASAVLSGCTPGTPPPYEIDPRLELELVAAEPLVFDPVDLEFDEHGRAFVLEMRGYPEVSEEEAPGVIVRLEDSDGDGRFDRRHPFADGFRYADSILPYRGGLLVADPPDILFVADTDGDGRADRRQVVLSGFRVGFSESNVNGLRRGLDNWIYGANGSSGGEVYFPDRPEERTSIARRDFRFRLDPARFETTARMGGGFGVTFDDWGRLFVTHEQRHIQHQVFPERYLLAAAAEFPWPSTTVEISDHGRGDSTRLYPVSVPEERVNHPEQSGYFSAGCGLTHYGGDALPPELAGSFFVADAVLNVVHRDRLEPAGSSFTARRGEEGSEVLAFRDPAARPVNFTVGPDGALYLLDMQRQVIEHPEWIPDDLEAELDVRAGEERGRIYRLVPRGGLPAPADESAGGRLERSDLEPVLAALSHPNQWWRDTAQRLLVEWRAVEAADDLLRLARSGPEPLGRLHALWTLDGLDRLDLDTVLVALDDPHPGVRENGVRLAERFLGEDELGGRLAALLADPAPRVRLQGVLTLGEWLRQRRGRKLPASIEPALVAVAERDAADPFARLAVVAAVSERPLPVLTALSARRDESTDGDGAARRELLARLAEVAAFSTDGAGLRGMLELLAGVEDDTLGLALADGLGRGLSSRPQRLEPGRPTPFLDRLLAAETAAARLAGWRLALALHPARRHEEAYDWAAEQTLDAAADLGERLTALELLGLLASGADDRDRQVEHLLTLLGVAHPPDLQAAAVEELWRLGGQQVALPLLERWRSLAPAARRRAADVLVYQRANHPLLLDALERGELRVGELNFDLERRRALLRSGDPEVRRRAEALFSDSGVATRSEALARMRPALELAGRPQAGRLRFLELCARCHRLGDLGHEVGPGLTDIFPKSAGALLHDIVDPNAAVKSEYLSFEVVDRQGRSTSGLLIAETARQVVLRAADGSDTPIPRSRIESLTSTGLSLMPEGLEEGLDLQGMADLIAFLQQPR